MSYNILNKVDTPEDIKKLTQNEAKEYCEESRRFLIEKVEKNGGHLASNLGTVELSVALHRVFNSPRDHIIFDVGHQAYVHKMITGRREDFDMLRRTGGLSGFTSRKESEHDPFGAGHSSTALSAAIGFAESDKLKGNTDFSVAVVGDGAYTGGMVHEAINNCKNDLRLIIVLNENGMSISSNKGAFASYLSHFIASKKYIDAKEGTRSFLNKIPLVGKPIASCISAVKRIIKKMIYETNYFEELGFYYIGPIDGNDLKKVEKALKQAKSLSKCVFVHLKTVKGKGDLEAESSPERFHSLTKKPEDESSFHNAFVGELIKKAESDDKVVAVTAAMGIGTGLSKFGEKFPSRYFDVGIAEPHAVTFAAGMAASGYKPFVAIYSTFLQRAYDNIVHDVALQSLPVRFFIDRAGLAVSDGPTHHGIFDVSFLSHIPNMNIFSPATYDGLNRVMDFAYSTDLPVAVRYPNALESQLLVSHFGEGCSQHGEFIKYDFDISDPPENIFVTYGQIAHNVILAQEILDKKGIRTGIILVEQIKPNIDAVNLISKMLKDDTHIVYVEEAIKNGSAAMLLRESLLDNDLLKNGSKFDIAAIDDNFASPSEVCDLYDYVGLSAEKLAGYFI